jgi:hypothetical protein
MITDALLKLSDAQAVTSTAVSTNTVDLGTARDIGSGEDLEVVFTVDEAATASGSATVEFQVIGSAAANLGSAVVLGSSGAIAKASLTLGAQIVVQINPQDIVPLGYRYLGANYLVATGPLTAGKFSANPVMNAPQGKTKAYASGFSVA